MDDPILSFSGRYDFLSNFYTHKDIEYLGLKANCVEKIYQALKTDDIERCFEISRALTAGEAKRMGNDREKTILRDDWNDETRIEVMTDLIDIKFKIPDLRRKLLLTQNRELIEGNHWKDTFWGMCTGPIGENNLGKILMRARKKIQDSRGKKI